MNIPENSLWELMDAVRGEVPAGEQKKYLLPMMTLASIETKKEDFNIPKECIWSEIIKNGRDLGERLDFAFKKLEEANSTLQDVFSSVSFTKVSDPTLHKLALQINQLSVKEFGGEIGDKVLSLSAEQEGKKGAEYVTPESLSKLVIQLLDINDGSSVYDPVAGTGLFLNKASRSAKHLSLYGQEVNKETWAISKMSAILYANQDMDLRVGDTLRNPKFIHQDGLQKFDNVVMDPPYSLRDWGYEEAQNDIYGRFFYGVPPKSSGDMAFILHALASLNEKGKAAIIVPHGVLFRGATEEKIRQKLIEEDVIEAVIGLPTGLLYSSSIPVAVLILNKNKQPNRKNGVFFINAEGQYEQFRTEKELGKADIKKIVETYRSGEEIERFSKWVPLKEIKNNSLQLQTYFEEDRIESLIGKVQVDKKEYEQMETISLKDAGKLFRGMNTPPANKMKCEDPTHLMVELSDVQEGQILIDSLTPISIEDNKNIDRYELREGDIIVSSRGTTIKMAVIPETSEYRFLLSHHFIGIRPKQTINPYFLKAFLESPVGMFYLMNNQKGSTVSVLTAKDIQDIPVPHIPYEQQEELAKRFIQSNQDYLNRMQEAAEIHQKEYVRLYEEMGLKSAYKNMD